MGAWVPKGKRKDREWYTPPVYIEAARQVMGGIDLDPASSEQANRVVQATEFFSIERCGLNRSWYGRVWLNPPYGQPLVRWFSEKLVNHYQAGEVTMACALVNNATETVWFQVLLSASSAVCFPKGRIKFWPADLQQVNHPLPGQAVLYLGWEVEKFKTVFSEFGQVLRR